jgi:hypothetical protein
MACEQEMVDRKHRPKIPQIEVVNEIQILKSGVPRSHDFLPNAHISLHCNNYIYQGAAAPRTPRYFLEF